MNPSLPDDAGKATRILIVDDDRALNKYLARMLEGFGFDCSQAFNTREARRLLNDRVFPLILCDINMPGESGLNLIADLLSTRNDAAVIMITAEEDREISRRAINLGVYSYLVKPFSESQLRISIDNALRRLNLETDLQAHVVKLEENLNKLRRANLKIQQQHMAIVGEERLKILLQFAGAAAHELNQPLTSLLGNIEMIERFPLTHEEREVCLKAIAKSGETIAAIVRKIQDISHVKTKSYCGREMIIDLDQAGGRREGAPSSEEATEEDPP